MKLSWSHEGQNKKFSSLLVHAIIKETQFRSFSVKVPLFTKRLRDLFLERSEIVPRQSDGRPEGSHNKQLILSHRKKWPELGFLDYDTLDYIGGLIYRGLLYSAQNIVKKDPGRARQNSLATAGTNFTKPGAQNKGDLCTRCQKGVEEERRNMGTR